MKHHIKSTIYNNIKTKRIVLGIDAMIAAKNIGLVCIECGDRAFINCGYCKKHKHLFNK
jgi:hypothetical protein